MQESASMNWRKWRLKAERKETATLEIPVNRGNLVYEVPGPDGIRWGLVNRIQAEIAAGNYDTEERFAQAEERMLARLAE